MKGDIYIVKHALTSGIDNCDGGAIEFRHNGNDCCYMQKEYATTKEQATQLVLQIKERKLKSILKQLAKLEAMDVKAMIESAKVNN